MKTMIIRARDLLRDGGICPSCQEWIEASDDPEGIWISCDCDAGFIGPDRKIKVAEL